MATPFTRTLRSLEAETFRPAGLIFVCAALMLAAWAAWFLLGRVAVYEVTNVARLEVSQAAHQVDARAPGRIAEIHFELGRPVDAGDLLIALDTDAEESRLEEERTRLTALAPEVKSLETEIQSELQALEAFQRTTRAALEEARSQLAEAEAPARLADEEARRMARLRSQGLASEIDDLRTRSEAQRRRAAEETMRLSVQRLERSS